MTTSTSKIFETMERLRATGQLEQSPVPRPSWWQRHVSVVARVILILLAIAAVLDILTVAFIWARGLGMI